MRLANINITVNNRYAPSLCESFYYPIIDISDLEEVNYCANEACGVYLDLHGDLICALTPECTFEEIAEAREYIIEEVNN